MESEGWGEIHMMPEIFWYFTLLAWTEQMRGAVEAYS